MKDEEIILKMNFIYKEIYYENWMNENDWNEFLLEIKKDVSDKKII